MRSPCRFGASPFDKTAGARQNMSMTEKEPAEPAVPKNFACPHCQKEIGAAKASRLEK